jgi:hypothetical protein
VSNSDEVCFHHNWRDQSVSQCKLHILKCLFWTCLNQILTRLCTFHWGYAMKITVMREDLRLSWKRFQYKIPWENKSLGSSCFNIFSDQYISVTRVSIHQWSNDYLYHVQKLFHTVQLGFCNAFLKELRHSDFLFRRCSKQLASITVEPLRNKWFIIIC